MRDIAIDHDFFPVKPIQPYIPFQPHIPDSYTQAARIWVESLRFPGLRRKGRGRETKSCFLGNELAIYK